MQVFLRKAASRFASTASGAKDASGAARDEAAAWKALSSYMSTGERLVQHAARRGSTVSLMRSHMAALGLHASMLPPVVHIAGTKGKGSTGAFVESCLRAANMRTLLYTSPHLVSVRERFRVNCAPATPEQYLRSFWWVHDRVSADLPRPNFFMMLTLVAFRMAQREAVDAVVLEVGVGGLTDATNAVVAETVACTGVTTLDWDHMEVLGNTLPEIATQKAGIFKRRVPAFTVPQRTDALAALAGVAKAEGADLVTVDATSLAKRMPNGEMPPLALSGSFQRTNAALAVALAETFMRRREELLVERAGRTAPQDTDAAAPVPKKFVLPPPVAAKDTPPPLPVYEPAEALPAWVQQGLAAASWAGRAQSFTVSDGAHRARGYVDGAHTERSMRHAIDWFCGEVECKRAQSPSQIHKMVLVFNCPIEKDTLSLVLPLTTVAFDAVYICGVKASKPTLATPPSLQTVLDGYVKRKQLMGDVEAVQALTEGERLEQTAGTGPEAPAAETRDWLNTLKELFSVSHTLPRLQPMRRRLSARVQEYSLGGSITTAASARQLPPSAPVVTVVPHPDEAFRQVSALFAADTASHASTVHHVLVTGSLYLVGAALEYFNHRP